MADHRHAVRPPRPRILARAILAGALLTPVAPATAQDEPRSAPLPEAGQALDELKRLLDELSRLIDRVPRYALPELTEDGDIIIRRKDEPEDETRPPDDPSGVIKI